MKGEDLGGFNINYAPDNHNRSGFVDITMLLGWRNCAR